MIRTFSGEDTSFGTRCMIIMRRIGSVGFGHSSLSCFDDCYNDGAFKQFAAGTRTLVVIRMNIKKSR